MQLCNIRQKSPSIATPYNIQHKVHVDFHSPSGFNNDNAKRCTIVGTPYWLTPEAINGNEGKIDASVTAGKGMDKSTLPKIGVDINVGNQTKVGQGAAGSVYLATDKKTQEKIVMKVMMQVPDEVVAEMKLLQTLTNHPYIVQVKEVARQNVDEVVMISEYMDMGSLTELLEIEKIIDENLMSEAFFAYITYTVLSAVQHLKKAGFILGEGVKSDNLLFKHEGTACVVKLGVNSIRKTSSAEVFKRDVWCIAVLLYELVTGEPPYMEFPPMRALFLITSKGIPPLPADKANRLSSDFLDFFASCSKMNVNDRPTVEQLLLHPFLKQRSCADSDKLFKIAAAEAMSW